MRTSGLVWQKHGQLLSKTWNKSLSILQSHTTVSARLNPPFPAYYFGNCILSSVTREKREILAGEEGLYPAAEMIGKSLHTKLNNEEGVLKV